MINLPKSDAKDWMWLGYNEPANRQAPPGTEWDATDVTTQKGPHRRLYAPVPKGFAKNPPKMNS